VTKADNRAIPLVFAGLLGVPGLLAAQEGGGLFDLDPGLGVWTIAVFLVVLFVLGKFAWGPMLAQLDAREGRIRDSIEEAGRMKEESAALLAEHRRELADARRQAQEIVSAGREAGERLRKEVEAKAREESERILERARTEIERERDQAMEVIRRESVELAIAAASRILGQRLDGEGDRRLVEEYLDQLDRPAAEA